MNASQPDSTENMLNRLFGRLKDTHLRELLKGSSVAFIIRIVGMVASYAFYLMITRNFGADVMGIFALSFTVLQVSSVLGKMGFDTALIRFIAEYSAQNKPGEMKEVYVKIVKVLVPVTFSLSLLVFLFSDMIAKNIFHKEYLGVYFKIASFGILPVVFTSINSQSLRGLKKIREFSFFDNVSHFFFASVILALCMLFADGNRLPLVAYVAGVSISMVLSFVLWVDKSGIRQVTSGESIRLKTVFDVSLPMFLSSSMFLIINWTDTIMLGIFSTTAEIGIYNVALKIARLASVTLFAINAIAAPKFAEFYGRGDIEGLGRTLRHSTKLIFWTSLPVLVICYSFPSFLLGIFGGEFTGGVFALVLLTTGQFVSAISGPVGIVLQMTGRQKAMQNILFLTTIINITLNIILIPKYGINGAAVSGMAAIIFRNISAVLCVRYYLKISSVYIPFMRSEK